MIQLFVVPLLIVLVILLLFFGAGRLRTIGRDLGEGISGFRSALGSGESESKEETENEEEKAA
ncbi:MAG: twin-arginine translocase TatA/TatE family subunit [Anaerolineae bacterium]